MSAEHGLPCSTGRSLARGTAGSSCGSRTHGLRLGTAQAPVRVAVTGRTVGLPLFESVEVFGRERTLTRIDAAAAKLRYSR
jgi:glutamyl/glutaminyl-tRNA synthetase